jgi:hypothetical protein
MVGGGVVVVVIVVVAGLFSAQSLSAFIQCRTV